MKQKYIFLILAVACFIGIILIFFIDGYMGMVDSLSLTSGEQAQAIEFQQWYSRVRPDMNPQIYGFARGTLGFTYTLDNRRFSSYDEDISITAWKNQKILYEVYAGRITAGAFGQTTVTWSLDTEGIVPENSTTDSEFTLEIKHGDIARRVIVHIPATTTIKAPPPIQ